MNLIQALNAAVAGLKANQTGMSVVAANVANAETPGYVRKTPILVSTAAGDSGVGVRVAGIDREVDQYVQRQYRVELSGANYADLRSQFYDRLQDVYGVPGSDSSLQSIYDNFTTALQGLSTTPDSSSAQSAVVSAAQVLTQQLNSMSSSVQGLRSDAEQGLSDAVTQANQAMKRIAEINQQLGTTGSQDSEAATLQDERDQNINQLATLMDIKVVPTDHNQVNIFTNSGIQLVGTQASTLTFDTKGSITPEAQWSSDPAQRGVGSVQLTGPNGGNVDLIASNSFRSGTIAAYIEMRDKVLPQAQAQLDGVASAMASALSDKTVNGSTASSGAQTGFDIDLGNLLAGNSVRVSYTDTVTNTTKTLTLVRVDDPGALPLSDNATTDPNDQVVGINVAGGMAGVVNQLNSLFSFKGLSFSNPMGTKLEVLDDGANNTSNVNSVSANVTVSSLTGGGTQLPFFVDGFTPYSGAITSTGPERLGFAGRIAVNSGLLSDPSKLVTFQTSPPTAAGDPTRPNFIYNQLVSGSLTFSPQSGIGTTSAPFSGSLPTFIRQLLSQQGEAASNAASLKQGQDVVLNSLQGRLNDQSSVNVDAEMANLLQLQNAYAANARVMTTVRDMFQMLMQM